MDRRDAMLQMAAAIGSVFSIGKLDTDETKFSCDDEILLAAASSFEIATQRLLIPTD